MFNLKHKLPIWIMGCFATIGFIAVNFLWTGETRPGTAAILLSDLFIHGPLVIGWFYLMFYKDELRPRLHWFWTCFGLLIIAWVWLTVYNTAVLEFGWAAILHQSEVPWYAISFGLLFAFYNLESAKPLWYCLYIWFWAGLFMYGPELLRALGLINFVSPYLSPEQAANFWNYWGWFISDALIAVVGFAAMFYIIKWRKSVLEKEGEHYLKTSAFLEGIGLWWVLLSRGLKKAFKK